MQSLEQWGRYQVIDRDFLPNFLFGPSDIVVALGQDGVVANTMKYLDGQPLIGVNPGSARYDGVLLPFVAATTCPRSWPRSPRKAPAPRP